MPGLVLGTVYGLIAVFIVPQFEILGLIGFGAPLPGHWVPQILLNAAWGFSLGPIYSLMAPMPGYR
jgi:hypothetical protein